MEANYENLLLHTEARWLSRGKVLSRIFEMKKKMLAFFSFEKQEEFYDLLCDDSRQSKLAYLVDIFDHWNKRNSSMQDKNENLLSSTDKMRALCHFSKTNNKEFVSSVIQHLKSLQEQIENNFPTRALKTIYG